MSYQPKFKSWQQLSIADLLVAYRKAKADCFFENSFPTAINFAKYEKNLHENLKSLLADLQTNSGFKDSVHLLGTCRLLPKKISLTPRTGRRNGHTHFSDPIRAFEHLRKTEKLCPEFRIIGDFPVEAHIISALWINMVGHKFDACLNEKQVYGSRLRRVRNDELLDKAAKKRFHITAVGSFESYFTPYKNWRSDGLNAIRSELDQGRPVIAVSLDLRSYYHCIDPSFLSAESFQQEIGIQDELSLEERDFTKQLSQFLCNWAAKANSFAEGLQSKSKTQVAGGLAIGLTASRIISNILLYKWDNLIRERLTPVHYGRYVDDMFLVLHDPGTNVINDTSTFMKFLAARLAANDEGQPIVQSGVDEEKDPWKIVFGKAYQAESKIELQADKQKIFILEGQAGCDLLDSIAKEISDLSSEHRLMPTPDQIEHTTAARVLSAAGKVGEEADTLRRADGLTVRRLSWSLQMRHVETLAHDLPSSEWKKQRDEFYDFAHNHVLRADKIIAHYQYLPRLLGFAINLKDWHQAEAIVRKSLEAIEKLAKHTEKQAAVNGTECEVTDVVWRYVKASLTWAFIDAAARYYPVDLIGDQNHFSKTEKLSNIFLKQLLEGLSDFEDLLNFTFDSEEFQLKAPLLVLTDLAKTPYKSLCSNDLSRLAMTYSERKRHVILSKEFKKADLINLDDLKEFLKAAKANAASRSKIHRAPAGGLLPFLLPTRPLTPLEIAEHVPACVGLGISKELPSRLWARYVSAVRGVWVNPSLVGAELKKDGVETKNYERRTIEIGKKNLGRVVVAISSLATEDGSWAATASNKPDLSLLRYQRLSALVNQAIKITPRPDYLLLPELSLPLRWIDSIANRLLGSGISLIAGTEYRHSETSMHSEACLVLSDDRLGYPASVRIWQPKKKLE